ncbi:MAG TPA: M20/M25/M40 family metallo-hydrolase [Gaiellaceae bacterium]|nr:M20/M25/M40 family metallo-hydrolase [Gaiellaceae bacterium]
MPFLDEVTALLQELLRLDTVNPPGNETRAAEALRGYFARNGIECELIAREPGRANVVARLAGGDGPSLAFLSHTDTVLADPGEWERDPWSGDLVDGEVWGRGALDMKGQVAASAVAFASLKREDFLPAGDLIFVSTADEEVGAGVGLSWLVEAYPDAVRCDYAVNEGGGDRLVVGGTPVYLCGTAEKMSAPFVLRVHGRSGHASMPGIADNALVKAARYVEALGAYEPPHELIPEARKFLEATLGQAPSVDVALERVRALDSTLGELVEPLLSPTLSPTMIDASHQRNVIPAACEVTVDCRLLPEQTPQDVEPLIRAALGDGSYEIEWIEAVGGTRSPIESPLWAALEEFTAVIEPGARLAPLVNPGFTDSHFLREAFGTVAYGYFPLKAMDVELTTKLVHSADERIAVDDLELGVEMFRSVARSLLGGT